MLVTSQVNTMFDSRARMKLSPAGRISNCGWTAASTQSDTSQEFRKIHIVSTKCIKNTQDTANMHCMHELNWNFYKINQTRRTVTARHHIISNTGVH